MGRPELLLYESFGALRRLMVVSQVLKMGRHEDEKEEVEESQEKLIYVYVVT